MSIVIEPASKSDRDAVMKAIWGTEDKMIESEAYRDCDDRQRYLIELIRLAVKHIDREIDSIRWWNLKGLIMAPIYRWSLNFVLIEPGRKLIKEYDQRKKFVIGFIVKLTNDKFDELIETNKEIIKQINKYEGITIDPYLK